VARRHLLRHAQPVGTSVDSALCLQECQRKGVCLFPECCKTEGLQLSQLFSSGLVFYQKFWKLVRFMGGCILNNRAELSASKDN
jgi:hypothetical protein